MIKIEETKTFGWEAASRGTFEHVQLSKES